jgi:release factor glutamine methyltransferase
MKLKEVLDRTVQFFKDKNIETPRLDTEILLTEALGYKNRVDLYLKFDQPLKDEELSRSREFVRRRSQGEPVAYIIGKKDFYGFTFHVNDSVLIPRPETELLVEEAINWAKKNQVENPKVLDMGCGSGCIGISFLKKVPGAQLIAVDKSAEALEVAKQNATLLEVDGRAEFILSDSMDLKFDPSTFDIILANPPYIAEDDPDVQAEVKAYEPEIALFAQESGFQALKGWSSNAKGWLKAKSLMGFEMGATQGPQMKKTFEGLQVFSKVFILKDLAALDRHIIGEKNG